MWQWQAPQTQHHQPHDHQQPNNPPQQRRRLPYPIQLLRHAILRDPPIQNPTWHPAPRHPDPRIVQHLLARDLGAGEHDRHAGPGVRARAHEVHLAEPLRPRARPERQHVEEAVAEPEDRALVQVELGLPRVRVVDQLVRDARPEVRAPRARADGREHGAPRLVDERGPVLLPRQPDGGFQGPAGLQQMSRGHERDEGVAALGGGARVDAAWYVDVEARFFRQRLPVEDGVEGLAVLVREEDVVSLQLGDFPVEAPVERYRAARTVSLLQGLAVGLGAGRLREEVGVGVD